MLRDSQFRFTFLSSKSLCPAEKLAKTPGSKLSPDIFRVKRTIFQKSSPRRRLSYPISDRTPAVSGERSINYLSKYFTKTNPRRLPSLCLVRINLNSRSLGGSQRYAADKSALGGGRRAFFTASINAAILSYNFFPGQTRDLPIGTCKMEVLSTRNSTRPALISFTCTAAIFRQGQQCPLWIGQCKPRGPRIRPKRPSLTHHIRGCNGNIKVGPKLPGIWQIISSLSATISRQRPARPTRTIALGKDQDAHDFTNPHAAKTTTSRTCWISMPWVNTSRM